MERKGWRLHSRIRMAGKKREQSCKRVHYAKGGRKAKASLDAQLPPSAPASTAPEVQEQRRMVEALLRVESLEASFEDATARLDNLEEKQNEITDDVKMMTCLVEANRERIEVERLQDVKTSGEKRARRAASKVYWEKAWEEATGPSSSASTASSSTASAADTSSFSNGSTENDHESISQASSPVSTASASA